MTVERQRRYIWDVPTRLFHWSLVGLMGFSWWSAENAHLDWHLYAGSAVVGLLVFRLLWGVFGTSSVRFTQFVKGPRGVWAYLRPGAGKAAAEPVGHNPLGSWSVIALLLLLCVQAVSGLFSVDVDGLDSGPFSHLIDFDQGRFAAKIHEISFNVLLGLIALHVLAILFYLTFKRRNLTEAMITGFQSGAGDSAVVAKWWKLVPAVVVGAGVAYWLIRQAPY